MAAIGIVAYLIWMALMVFIIYCEWKVYEKAGRPGWSAIIPIYNLIILLEMAGKPAWWVVLFFIPIVNLVFMIIAYLELGKRFGKSGVWSFFLLIVFSFVGWIILAFDDSVYNASGAMAGPDVPPTIPTPPTQQPVAMESAATPVTETPAAPTSTPEVPATGTTPVEASLPETPAAEPPSPTPADAATSKEIDGSNLDAE